MSMSEFILARVAEDEASATIAAGDARVETGSAAFVCDEQGTHVGLSPERVLRQCEAIRRTVPIADAQSKWDAMGSATDEDGWAILEALASIWADHPDHPYPQT